MRRSPVADYESKVAVRHLEPPTLWGTAPSLSVLRPTAGDVSQLLRRRLTVHLSLLGVAAAVLAGAAFTTTHTPELDAAAIATPDASDSLVVSAQASIVARAIPSTTASSDASYMVAPGDTLSSIARRMGITEEALLAYNGLASSDALTTGLKLSIPNLALVSPDQLRLQDTAPHQTVPPLPDSATDQRPQPELTVHTIVSGDTIYGLAIDAGVSEQTVLESNNLTEDSHLVIGQQIVIPGLNGRLVATKPGDTVQSLAATYAGTPEAIDLANKLPPQTQTVAGNQLLLIPTDSIDILKAVAPSAAPTAGTRSDAVVQPISTPPPPRPASSPGFSWPAPGIITTYFSGWHNGIDVANSTGTPVRAVQAGVVTYSGWDNSGYGYMIRIDHGNGLQTLYGHASRLIAKVGQYVDKGDVIMLMGSTGNSTGPHVHFSVFQGSGYSALNPLRFLP